MKIHLSDSSLGLMGDKFLCDSWQNNSTKRSLKSSCFKLGKSILNEKLQIYLFFKTLAAPPAVTAPTGEWPEQVQQVSRRPVGNCGDVFSVLWFSEDLLFKGQTDNLLNLGVLLLVFLSLFSFILFRSSATFPSLVDSGSSCWRLWICLPLEWSVTGSNHTDAITPLRHYIIYLPSWHQSPVATAPQTRWHPCCHPTAATHSPHINIHRGPKRVLSPVFTPMAKASKLPLPIFGPHIGEGICVKD